MSNSITIWAFKNRSSESFFDALNRASKTHAYSLTLHKRAEAGEVDCRTAFKGDICTLYLPYLGGDEREISKRIGSYLACPWCLLTSGGEGSQWGYEFFNGSENVDKFWPAPEYWSDDRKFCSQFRGNPAVWAALWGGSIEEYANYLIPWKIKLLSDDEFIFESKGKAQPSDSWGYGDSRQMWDYLNMLGGNDPINVLAHAQQHTLSRI